MKKRKYFIPIITILTASLFCGCGSQKKEYVPGEVTDAGYESEFLGLRFTTPEDFNLLGKVEIDGMMETAMPTADDITKETQKEYEDNTQITEFMATSEDAMTLASVTLEKTTESLEDYIETFKTDYFENMDNNVINDVTIEINSQIVGDIEGFELAGETYKKLVFASTVDGYPLELTAIHYFRKVGDYIMNLTVSDYGDEASVEVLMGAFEAYK